MRWVAIILGSIVALDIYGWMLYPRIERMLAQPYLTAKDPFEPYRIEMYSYPSFTHDADTDPGFIRLIGRDGEIQQEIDVDPVQDVWIRGWDRRQVVVDYVKKRHTYEAIWPLNEY